MKMLFKFIYIPTSMSVNGGPPVPRALHRVQPANRSPSREVQGGRSRHHAGESPREQNHEPKQDTDELWKAQRSQRHLDALCVRLVY